MRFLAYLAAAGMLTLPIAAAEMPQQYDFVIYGPTSAGVAAAVQVKKMGKSVVVVGPDQHLGGLSAGGLGWTDSGNKAVIGGISREFYQRVKKYYDKPATWKWQDSKQYSRYRADDDAHWTFEPHIAERVFEDLVREYEIPVLRDEWLDRGDGVEMKDNRIQSITMLSGKTFTGSIFIDATYEGDLMAAAGISFHVGREANSQYKETLNGVQIANARSHQFTHDISPYKTPGDPSSGLLPRVWDEPPGKQGEGDHRVQAYNFRMCLTRVPENRVPFPKPDDYDANQYELLLRTLLAGSRHITGKFDML
ncbi:MAG: FAD-dependent oxidoreductase, partial [Pirellulales bacterium]